MVLIFGLNFSNSQNVLCINHLKIQTRRSFHREIFPKGADGMANGLDADQISPR